MLAVYNFLLPFLIGGLRLLSSINPKLRRGLNDRRTLLSDVQKYYHNRNIARPRILVHVASFGELEQAKPVIAALKLQLPNAHIHLTFFSPSGYENAKGKYLEPDFISYSPLDIRPQVEAFLDAVQPTVVLFTRYDVWPNMAFELSRRHIATVLFAATASGASRRMMPFAKALHSQIYSTLTKILTISEQDRDGFISMGIPDERIVIAGDTRYDQVIARKAQMEANGVALLPNELLLQIEHKGTLVFVIGSAWPQDEAIAQKALKESIERKDNILWIIAPHEPSDEHIAKLSSSFTNKWLRLSEIENYSGQPIVIVDSVGKLFGLYQYADIAMVGGGFSQGLHNVLEPAAWCVPTIVGPNHRKSQEVQQLIDSLGTFEVTNAREFEFAFWRLVQDTDLRRSTGEKAQRFVEVRRGATEEIVTEIKSVLQERS